MPNCWGVVLLGVSISLFGCSFRGGIRPVWSIPRLEVVATPIIHEGIVYVIGRPLDAKQPETRLYALHVKTGKQIWISSFTPSVIRYIFGKKMLVSGLPANGSDTVHLLDKDTGRELPPGDQTTIERAVDVGGVLYAVFRDRSVAAMDSSLRKLWTVQLPSDLEFVYAPVVAGDSAYLVGSFKLFFRGEDLRRDSMIVAVDAKTGIVRWKWETKDKFKRRPPDLIWRAADSNSLYVATVNDYEELNHGFTAFDARTGVERWNTRANRLNSSAGPLLLDPSTLLILDRPPGFPGENHEAGLILRALNPATGQELWRSATSSKYRNWDVVDGILFGTDSEDHGGRLYGGTRPDSWLTAVDIRTGKDLWRSRVVELSVFTSPAIGDGMVIVGSYPHEKNLDGAGLYAFGATRNGR